MTVSSTYTPPQFTGNGTATQFGFAYNFFAPTDLVVLLFDTNAAAPVSPQPVLNGSGTYDYTVAGTQDPNTGEYLSGGTITFNNAPLGNHQITIQRNVPPQQPVSLSNLAPFPAKTIEGALDRAAIGVQQALARAGTALQLNPNDSVQSYTLPPAGQRAGLVLAFDSNGNPTLASAPAAGGLISTAMAGVTNAASLSAGAAALLANGAIAAGDMSFPSVATGWAGMFRNRLTNGDCRIDQQNQGAAQNGLGTYVYTVDQWRYSATQAGKFNAQQNAGSITPPNGFAYYLGLTVASAYTVGPTDSFIIGVPVEGFDIEDLAWGTSAARPATVLAWVQSSIAGTHSGAVRNGTGTRSYPFTFTIASANTWTRIAIQIPGDTAGTWPGGAAAGLSVDFNLGSGSNFAAAANAWAGGNYVTVSGAVSIVGTAGATFKVTGAELRDGTWTTAAAPERRPFAHEATRCQRYYWNMDRNLVLAATPSSGSSLAATLNVPFPTPMRAPPTVFPIWTAGSNNSTWYVYDIGASGCMASLYSITAGTATVTLAAGTVFSARL